MGDKGIVQVCNLFGFVSRLRNIAGFTVLVKVIAPRIIIHIQAIADYEFGGMINPRQCAEKLKVGISFDKNFSCVAPFSSSFAITF